MSLILVALLNGVQVVPLWTPLPVSSDRALSGTIQGGGFPANDEGWGEVKPGRDPFLPFPNMTRKLPRDTPRFFYFVESLRF